MRPGREKGSEVGFEAGVVEGVGLPQRLPMVFFWGGMRGVEVGKEGGGV